MSVQFDDQISIKLTRLLEKQQLANEIAYQQLRALRVLAKLDSPQDEQFNERLNG